MDILLDAGTIALYSVILRAKDLLSTRIYDFGEGPGV